MNDDHLIKFVFSSFNMFVFLLNLNSLDLQ